MASAVIVAAGSGTRMRINKAKQYLILDGKSILEKTLDVFDACDFIDDIVLVLPAQDVDEWENKLRARRKKYKVVCGGTSRTESSFNGIKAVSGQNEVVVIHDGVRPFVTTEQIKEVIQTANLNGAATLALKSKDTVKIVDWENRNVKNTLDRDEIALIQTPQAFKLHLIMSAYKSAIEDNLNYFDDCSLIEKIGGKVKIVEGSPMNIKITVPEDLELAKFFCRRDFEKAAN